MATFTPEHTKAIVEILGNTIPEWSRGENPHVDNEIDWRLHDEMVDSFANMLKAHNPEFDKKAFKAAVRRKSG